MEMETGTEMVCVNRPLAWKLTTVDVVRAVGSRCVGVVSAGCTGGATVHVLVASNGARETLYANGFEANTAPLWFFCINCVKLFNFKHFHMLTIFIN